MRILILGAGGHGQVVANVLHAMHAVNNEFEPVGYLDDDDAAQGEVRLGLPVLGRFADLSTVAHDGVIAGIGDNRRRAALHAQLVRQGERLITAVHPTAVISYGATLGCGTLVCALAVVGTDVALCDNVIMNACALVGHHTRVAHHAHIGPGAHLGGEIVVGEGALVGLGANVMSRRTVGAWAQVGAGALVEQNVAAGLTVIGVPARPLHKPDKQTY